MGTKGLTPILTVHTLQDRDEEKTTLPIAEA